MDEVGGATPPGVSRDLQPNDLAQSHERLARIVHVETEVASTAASSDLVSAHLTLFPQGGGRRSAVGAHKREGKVGQVGLVGAGAVRQVRHDMQHRMRPHPNPRVPHGGISPPSGTRAHRCVVAMILAVMERLEHPRPPAGRVLRQRGGLRPHGVQLVHHHLLHEPRALVVPRVRAQLRAEQISELGHELHVKHVHRAGQEERVALACRRSSPSAFLVLYPLVSLREAEVIVRIQRHVVRPLGRAAARDGVEPQLDAARAQA
mmetsp:Transcript_25274/g.61112  ORF Transcript_25274/g.61112 Transcript_25274/m.61112 type:complete len:262 (-) Transcript_25274:67-852(-)